MVASRDRWVWIDSQSVRVDAFAEMPINPRFPPASNRLAPLRAVEFVAFPSVQMLDLTGPMQVFASANDAVTEAGRMPPYSFRVVARDGQSITASSGLGLTTDALSREDAPLDTLVIAGGPGVDAAAADPVLVDWILWTSAGVTAGIDLALALVEEDLGREVALAVARYLVVFLKRPGGEAQFSTALSLQMADHEFGALHAWINEHLDRDLSLPILADQAAMSEHSFSRHYREATGLTPARAVERLRVEQARRLLSESKIPIKRIALRCGFDSEETLRRSFLRLLAATPQKYRARFGSGPSVPS